jgi:hypothetical protein
MSDKTEVARPGALDIVDDRFHEVGDGNREEVAGLAAPTRQVDREHGHLGCPPVDFVDGEPPRVAGKSTTVDEHEGGQGHRGTP